MHLQLVIVHRNFCDRGRIAVEAHELRQAAVHPLCRWLAPTCFFRDSVENGKVLGMLRHQPAAELKRIFAGCVRQLIHKALKIDGVVVDIDAAPETRWYMWVAHCVINQQVRNRVPDCELPARIEPLEDHWVLTVLQPTGALRTQDRLPRDAHVEGAQVSLRVESAHQLSLRERMELAM